MTKEWAYAIGHLVDISNETVAELAERIAPLIAEVIKRRGEVQNDEFTQY